MTPSASGLMRRRAGCRLCDSRELRDVLVLKDTPPANAFVPEEQLSEEQPVFPLTVRLCADCGHAQLSDIVDPEILFRDYVYVSSTSPVFVEHFRAYAAEMIEYAGLRPKDTVLEIGSNDGALLRFFQDAGMRVLGIDPARKIAEQATQAGIRTLAEFFTPGIAAKLGKDGWRGARLIAANNVFAHADDLDGIARGVRDLLAEDGIFVFEVSYWVDVFQKTLFDTIYHEHLSYHTVKPLQRFFAERGMELVETRRVDTHGGSLRGIAQKKGGPHPVHASVAELIALEESLGLYLPETYERFAQRIDARKRELAGLLRAARAKGRRIAGFGAPAKATTLMHHFELDKDSLDYIIDDSPWKQGLYTPGYHIPVVESEALYAQDTRPDDVVILAWNFAEPIMKKHQRFLDAGGRFIVPLPEVRVVENSPKES